MVSPRVVRRGLVLGGCLLAATSLADDEYPPAVVDRPLTLTTGLLRGDLGLGFIRLPDYGAGSQTAIGLSLGAGYGIMDKLEVSVGYGLRLDDFDSGNPRLSTTYSLLRDAKFELAARANVTYLHEPPIGSFVRGDFSIAPEVVGKYLLTPDLRLDASLGVPLTFGDTTTIGLALPISATYGITDQLYTGVSTGLGIYDFDYLDNTVVPFGVFGGYTTKFACYGMIDFKARLGFPELWVPNAGEMQDSSYPGFVEGMLEASLYWGGPINCNNDGDDPRDVADPCKGRIGQGTLTRDYGGNAGPTPTPKGRVFEFPPAPNTGTGTGVTEAFTLLDFYLGGAGRSFIEIVMVQSMGVVVDEHGNPAKIPMAQQSKGLETDSVILSGDFVDYLQQQASVIGATNAAKMELGNDAQTMLDELGCQQSGTFTDHGTSGPIMADGTATTLTLALGTFTLYWDATCEIGPKQCCLPDQTCPNNQGTRSPYNCQIKFTQYDTYNFSRTSGTGGSGWLKALNPIGWFGTKFTTFSYWNSPALGYVTGCM